MNVKLRMSKGAINPTGAVAGRVTTGFRRKNRGVRDNDWAKIIPAPIYPFYREESIAVSYLGPSPFSPFRLLGFMICLRP